MGQCSNKYSKGQSISKLDSLEDKFIRMASRNAFYQTGRVNSQYEIYGSIRLKTLMLPEVYKARHKKTKQERIIRFYSNSTEKEVMDIINILDKINHPNIPKIFAYYIHNDENWIFTIQDNCEGHDLHSQIKKQEEYNEKDAAFIIKQLLSAVATLHKNNIMHRNISHDAIMFKSSNTMEIQLQDFEFAVEFEKGEKTTGDIYLENVQYKAPEIQNIYNYKCDLWSVGILTFKLLSGTFPILNEQGCVDLQEEYQKNIWQYVSKEAKNFIQKLLQSNPEKRITALQGIKDVWITKFTLQKSDHILPNLTQALKNIQNYSKEKLLKQAIYTFVSSHLLTKQEHDDMYQTFLEIDTDGNGTISRQELKEGYKKVNVNATEKQIDDIFTQLEEGQKEINFQDWVQITSQYESIVSKDKLEKAFTVFDTDDDGQLSITEIQRLFKYNKKMNKHQWDKLFKEFDTNQDGMISLQEFISTMQNHQRDQLINPYQKNKK